MKNINDDNLDQLNKFLIKSRERLIGISKLLDGHKLSGNTPRKQISGSLFSVAMEHHSAIHLLVDKKIYGSSFALMRPLFESFVRGCWAAYCASEENIIEIMDAKNKYPSMNKMLNSISDSRVFDSSVVCDVWENHGSRLHEFVHSGYSQFVRHISEDELGPNYDYAEVIEVVDFSDYIGMNSSLLLCDVYGDNNKISDLLTLWHAIQEKYDPEESSAG